MFSTSASSRSICDLSGAIAVPCRFLSSLILVISSTIVAPLQAGTASPELTLSSTSGESIPLSGFCGPKNVLLACFPLAFTSSCTSELCAFSHDFDDFTAAELQVLPISVDAVPSLKEFRSRSVVEVLLLSDFKREASAAFGVLRADTIFSNRAYVLIDKTGAIAWSDVEATPGTTRENADTLDAIRAIAV
ncbi:redoxin domain-containing protein [Gemmatimonas sp.]|uniref:redoxin domain-containing protein n=1 Tax=Gemmatimonas sp. TaxID=1962908 RepID=UPI0039835E88